MDMRPWKCPHCRLETDVAAGLPVRCSCGAVSDDAGRLLEKPVPLVFRWGDMVAGMAARLGVRPCGKCKRRRAALNRASISLYRKVQ